MLTHLPQLEGKWTTENVTLHFEVMIKSADRGMSIFISNERVENKLSHDTKMKEIGLISTMIWVNKPTPVRNHRFEKIAIKDLPFSNERQ